jgi:signal transduction histidine kinase
MNDETAMNGNGNQRITGVTVPLRHVADALRQTRPFAEVDFNNLPALCNPERILAKAGDILIEVGEVNLDYWVVLSGELRAELIEADGSRTKAGLARAGEAFGETPLMLGRKDVPFQLVAVENSEIIRFTQEDFWKLIGGCPTLRNVVLADVAMRLRNYQVEALHREKLVSLGTLAAGLMHELYNPSSAAKRAASQLREYLMRLQKLSLRFSENEKPKTREQIDCMRGLLEHSMHGCKLKAMSSLEQADAEEAMGEWLSSFGVENAFTIAPVLVGMGFDEHELKCAREFFDAGQFSDALNWLESLVSSVGLVCAIEESITRLSDLVMAVKKFAYEDRGGAREIDVHDSLQSTLVILGHKLRIRQLEVEKHFDASPAVLRTRGVALGQVWTNLIDNAADASPANSRIEISTWNEPGWLAVSITDSGEGIPADVLPRIFEPFFTTKPQGHGTGLGLEIVHRIVTQKFGGTIQVDSAPGKTSFIVRLPRDGSTVVDTVSANH